MFRRSLARQRRRGIDPWPQLQAAHPYPIDTRTADTSNIRIDNFGRVDHTYYRGAEPPDDQYAALATLGIKTVIDLRSGDVEADDKRFVERAGMKYAHIPMTTHQPPTPSMVETFLAIVTEPANQPGFVQWRRRGHRTGVHAAAIECTIPVDT